MAPFEKLAITLRPDDLTFIDQIAKEKAVGRSAVIRWAIDYYRSFLTSSNSTYRIVKYIEGSDTLPLADIHTAEEGL